MQNKLRIAIFTEFPFPFGLSGTNRLISYSKGLVELGNYVKIFIGKPTEERNKKRNEKFKGNYWGIKFSYPFKKIIKSRTRIGKGIDFSLGLIKTLTSIYIDHLNQNFDVIIIANDNPLLVFILSYFAQTIKIKKTILIIDEYPLEIRKGASDISLFNKLLFKFCFKKISGIVSMTNSVEKYYRKNFKVKNSFILPMTVENQRFINCKNFENSKDNYIAYIGNLDIAKDGLDILIKSFFIVSKKYPKLKLYLCGENRKKQEMVFLKNLVKNLGLEKQVIFMGNIKRDDVPKILCRAKALLLSRPNSKRAEGGFPTKLGEYLATGNPVVVTKVGEIHNYLVDNYNAFIAKPGDELSFAEKILQIFDNPYNAQIVGGRGKLVALKEFDYKVQSNRLFSFINSL